jgi:hypothetical protein
MEKYIKYSFWLFQILMGINLFVGLLFFSSFGVTSTTLFSFHSWIWFFYLFSTLLPGLVILLFIISFFPISYYYFIKKLTVVKNKFFILFTELIVILLFIILQKFFQY